MRDRLVSRELNPLLTTLPDKFQDIYNYQIDAITEIISAFDDGYRMVVLEAPTGSGKTFIAEVVRRMLKTRAVYVCHNKELQLQFARDFPYSRVLMGRVNYEPPIQIEKVTCEDCAGQDCTYCPEISACPYTVAKRQAIFSPVPVLNSAYWLNEVQGQRSRFTNTGLAILDEADTLENVLMGQVEVYVGERAQKKYGIRPPEKLTVQAGYADWCKHALDRIQRPLSSLLSLEFPDLTQQREIRRLGNLQDTLSIMSEDLSNEWPWVYTGGAGSKKRTGEVVSFKPVRVDRFGERRVWSRDKRFLLMAALLPDVVIGSLGWKEPYKRVMVESQFKPVNRQVVVKPIAKVTRKGFDAGQLGQLRDGVNDIIREVPTGRVLIHSVSYSLREQLYTGLQSNGRRVLTYRQAGERARAIQEYKDNPASILVAPGLERGLDLPDDLCRAQIICKVPFLSLGDKQVESRYYRTPDGKVWYNNHVATTVLQMVGRGVRHREDWCTTYVLDETFVGWYKMWGHLLPQWFRRSVRIEY